MKRLSSNGRTVYERMRESEEQDGRGVVPVTFTREEAKSDPTPKTIHVTREDVSEPPRAITVNIEEASYGSRGHFIPKGSDNEPANEDEPEGIGMDASTVKAAVRALGALGTISDDEEVIERATQLAVAWAVDGHLPDGAAGVALSMVEDVMEYIGGDEDSGCADVLLFAINVLEDVMASMHGEALRLRTHVDELNVQLAAKTDQPEEA